MKLLLKILLGLVVAVVLLVCGTVALAMARWQRTFSAPLPAITASTDSAVIARGRYLAIGPARCVECHAAAGQPAGDSAPPALSGGHEFVIPIGTLIVPNITPHPSLGIGRYSDGQLARALRYGVRHDGRVLIPFMEYEGLSDEDTRAIISYLRSRPAVAREVPDHKINLLGKMVLAFVMKPPPAPVEAPPATSPAESATVDRGRYLAEAVATCASCHTKRSHTDGSFLGPRYAGGSEFEGADPSVIFTSPNITPANSGQINKFSEDQFVARFRQGPLLPGTPMPWKAFGTMTESDIRAIYRYLKSLSPVENDPGPTMRTRT